MSEEIKLSRIKLFWWALLGPICVACVVAVVIIVNSNLIFDFTHIGFSKVFEVFKVPLSIMALSFPLVALVATNHRSAQSAEMLRRSTIQNAFSNYYKHREEFFKVLTRLEDELDVTFNDGNGLYRRLFPHNSVERLDLRSVEKDSDKSALEFHAKKYEDLMESIRTPALSLRQVQNFFLEFFLLSRALGFVAKEGRVIDWRDYFGIERSRGWSIIYTDDDPLKHCWITSQVLIRLSDFCHVNNGVRFTLFTPYPSFSQLAKEAFALCEPSANGEQERSPGPTKD